MRVRAQDVCVCAALIASFTASPARAYQNAMRFSESVDSGGGGGRFFTGSPADGYTCDVCHTIGNPTTLKVAGLPLEGYQPGKSYNLMIDWPDNLEKVAMNLEVTDENGAPLGQLSIPTDIADADKCPNGQPALLAGPATPEMRNVAFGTDCGGHQGRLVWTAPPAGAEATDAWLSGSFVVSNMDEKVEGDSVTSFRRVIPMQGGAQVAPIAVKGSCSIAAAPTHAAGAPLALLAGVVALRCASRRRRR